MADEKIKAEYSAKDVRKLAKLSYRQLNSRDSKGVIPNQRKNPLGWRKFSPRDVFVIALSSEIHKQFGIPFKSLGYLKRMMLQPNANHFLAAAELLDGGMTPCLLTNLKNHFILQSAEEVRTQIQIITHTDSKIEGVYILINLSPLVKRLVTYFQKAKS